MPPSASRAAAIGVLLWACGGNAEPGDGGSVDAGGPTVPSAEIPWLADGEPAIAAPGLTPCASGWRAVPSTSSDGFASCDPYPEGGALACPFGEAHFPGEPGCAPVGSACPAGEWADGLPDDGSVLFVRAGATGGDGSRAAPLGTMREAMLAATDGTTVALSKGTYAERAVFSTPGVILRGACSAQTLISSTDLGFVVQVDGLRASLRDLAVVGDSFAALSAAGAGTDLQLDGVVIVDQTGFSLVASQGARVDARSLFVRSPGAMFPAVVVDSSAQVSISRGVVEDGAGFGIDVQTEGASLRLEDVVLRGAEAGDSGSGGGIRVNAGASALLVRILVEDNSSVGITVLAGSNVRVTESVVRNTRPRADGEEGLGLFADASSLELERVLVERSRTAGVFSDGGGRLIARDLVVRTTAPRASDRFYGRGVQVQGEVSSELTRVQVEDAHDLGIGLRTGLHTLSDVVIRDVEARAFDEQIGSGLQVSLGAEVAVSRLRVERSRDAALAAFDPGTRVTVEDAVLRDTLGQASDGLFGRGVNANDGAEIEVSRALLERNRGVAALALGPASALRLVDVVVRDTQERACAQTTCPDQGAGSALGAVDWASLSATRFRVERSALCGVLISRDGEMDLMTGAVVDNPIGACVRSSGYDVARLMNGVLFLGNAVIFEAVDISVPDASNPSGL